MAIEALFYLLEVSAALILIYLVCRLVLRGNTFHQMNRFLLVGGLLLVFMVPAIQISVDWAPQWQLQNTFSIWKNNLVIHGEAVTTDIEELSTSPANIEVPHPAAAKAEPVSDLELSWSHLWSLLLLIWAIGFVYRIVRLGNILGRIRKLKQLGIPSHHHGIQVITLPGTGSPFSWFNTIFDYDQHSESARDMILAHEAAHVKQRHSIDRIVLQMVGAVLWFHPLLPAYRRLLIETHEYLADRAVVREKGSVPYAHLLLGLALKRTMPAPVHHFATSSTRKRIIMIKKTPSGRRTWLRYVLLAPAVAALVLLFSIQSQADSPSTRTTIDSELAQAFDGLTFAGENVPTEIPEVRQALEAALADIRSRPDRFAALLKKEIRWRPELEQILEGSFSPKDLYYQAVAESELERQAISPMSAAGMWQFMPETARHMGLEVNEGIDERWNVKKSTVAASHLMMKLKSQFGSWTAAAVAYNRGSAALRKDRDAGRFNEIKDLYQLPESRNYLIRIAAFKIALQNPELMGMTRPTLEQYKENAPSGSPLSGPGHFVTAEFGKEMMGKVHKGVDMRASIGTPVFATASGTVILAREEKKYGKVIVIQHGADYETLYAHLSELEVKVGDRIQQGQQIGRTGNTGLSTGPHLHYEVRKQGTPVKPDGC